MHDLGQGFDVPSHCGAIAVSECPDMHDHIDFGGAIFNRAPGLVRLCGCRRRTERKPRDADDRGPACASAIVRQIVEPFVHAFDVERVDANRSEPVRHGFFTQDVDLTGCRFGCQERMVDSLCEFFDRDGHHGCPVSSTYCNNRAIPPSFSR